MSNQKENKTQLERNTRDPMTLNWIRTAMEGLKKMSQDPDLQKEIARRATSKEKHHAKT